MKYKVGDKVRVRGDLEVGQVYGDCVFVKKMRKFRGKIMTIEKVYFSRYHLHGGGTWYFTHEMLEDVDEMNINITAAGKIVTAQMGDKYGVAKCSPDDKFDFFTGAKLALERLEEQCKPYAWLKPQCDYWIPGFDKTSLCMPAIWRGDRYDKMMLERGLVFKTAEEATEAAKKMLAVLKEG